ncbi:MAG: hypothetical protein ACXVQ4_09065 [Gaiellaceae bacterium]
MDEVRVTSWIELQECLFTGTWHEELARHRSDFSASAARTTRPTG